MASSSSSAGRTARRLALAVASRSLARNPPQPPTQQLDHLVDRLLVGDAEMAASAHVLFDQPVNAQNTCRPRPARTPDPAHTTRLLAYIVESRAERAAEPLGYVMEGCAEVLVLEFDHVDEDQQEVLRILGILARIAEATQSDRVWPKDPEPGDGLSKPFGDQRAVLLHQADEKRFFAGIMSVNRRVDTPALLAISRLLCRESPAW